MALLAAAATQAEEFFINGINNGTGIGKLVWQATSFLLGDSVSDEFAEIANMLKAKVAATEDYSAINTATDLATLQHKGYRMNLQAAT